MDVSIAAVGVEKHYGEVHALRGVDLVVNGGETRALVGPNGAGKTTLLRILAGLTEPSAGTCRRHGAAGEGSLGYCSQDVSLYPSLTVLENLVFFAGTVLLRGTAFDRSLERAVDALALEGLLKARCRSSPVASAAGSMSQQRRSPTPRSFCSMSPRPASMTSLAAELLLRVPA